MGGPGSGRRPKPPEQRKGHRSAAVVPVSAAVVTIPRRPVGLKDRGQREWGNVWAAGEAWLSPEQDYHWVEQIARAYDDIADYRRQVRADGNVAKGAQNQPVSHPLIAEIRRCEDRIDKNLSIIGFSPTDRARLGLAQAKTASKLDELAARREARNRPAPAAADSGVIEAVVISDSADDTAW